MAFPSRRSLQSKLELALIYSPFIRLLLFNRWFQFTFGAAFLIVLVAALSLPKIWTTSPPDFLPVVRISILDLAQNWALKRTAAGHMEQRDFVRASKSWEAAVAQNPADVSAVRGYLANALNLQRADRQVRRSAVTQIPWLLLLTHTNASDVQLAARVTGKFDWHDASVYYLGNISAALPPEAEAVYLKALFHQGRLHDFKVRFEKTGAGLADDELPFYALTLQAAGRGSWADEAEQELARAAASGRHAVLATRLHMVASRERGDPEAYFRDLQTLGLRNEDTASDHANYWILLNRRNRHGEATKLAEAFTRAPASPAEAVRMAEAYTQLGMLETARELLRKTAPAFPHSPEVWLTYGAVLEQLSDWSGMRAIALRMREELTSRETLWGYSYYLEGRAELAGERVASAERAFEKAIASTYEIPPIGFTVADGLTRLKYPAFALRLFQSLEGSFANDPVFWDRYFDAAFSAQSADAVLKVSERCLALSPRDATAHNRHVAALLVNRSKPDEAIQHTLKLVASFPDSLAARINHSFALLLNHRASEALALLEPLDPDALSLTEASDFNLALFEAYHQLQRWDDAARVSGKIIGKMLFPPQRDWLNKKLSEIPARHMAVKN